MANVLIGHSNLIESATLSGGSWQVTLEALKSRRLGYVARSTNLLLTSTRFVIDLGANPSDILRVLALSNHNFSLDAQYRFYISNAADGSNPLAYSDWQDVWPTVYVTENLQWESQNFWGGQYTEKERQGYIWTLIHSLPEPVIARYVVIEISDPNNVAGYIQIGRAFIGDAWQPRINMSYGAGLAWETGTQVQETISGTEFFDPKTPYRVARFTTDWMSEDEAFGNVFDIQRRSGIDKEVVFQYDPDDTVHKLRRQFIGRLRQLNPIEHPNPAAHGTGWEIKELI